VKEGSTRRAPTSQPATPAAFEDLLNDWRERMERALAARLPASDVVPTRLHEAMRYSVLGGGKRIRSALVFATALTVGLTEGEVEAAACAIELVHAYSLVHDDLPAMDDDELRRGRPTCHRVFGEDVAILAGDALYAEAFRHLLTLQQDEPERVLAAAAELALATGVNGMVGGQYLDVYSNSAHEHGGGVDLRRVHELKTGRLIGASVTCVLLLAGAPEPATIAFRRFAAELGVLFQIVDDILDVTGTDAALGKPSGSDERHGRHTYVSEFGIKRARELAADSHSAARAALAQAASASVSAPGGPPPTELEQITDFIYTRSS